MKAITFCVAAALILCSCNKTKEALVEKIAGSSSSEQSAVFTIRKGQHYADQSSYRTIETSELRFTAVFDSSAIYRTADPANQDDINKLYGFSDNGTDHHSYSARFGWRWSNGALRLFGYVYNAGKVTSEELAAVAIGSEIRCSIRVTDGSYLFTVNGNTRSLPRQSTTPSAKGYRLYPYFGGDETAPHDMKIIVREG